MSKYFEDIKNMSKSESSLLHFDLDLELVASDAIDFVIGAVTCHKFNYGKIKAVAHAMKQPTCWVLLI